MVWSFIDRQIAASEVFIQRFVLFFIIPCTLCTFNKSIDWVLFVCNEETWKHALEMNCVLKISLHTQRVVGTITSDSRKHCLLFIIQKLQNVQCSSRIFISFHRLHHGILLKTCHSVRENIKIQIFTSRENHKQFVDFVMKTKTLDRFRKITQIKLPFWNWKLSFSVMRAELDPFKCHTTAKDTNLTNSGLYFHFYSI